MRDELRVAVEERLEKKRRRAEDAFVREGTEKTTVNCRHHGAAIAARGMRDQLFECRLRCQGGDEFTAASCHHEKARGCSDFALIRQPEALRRRFRELSEEELALRWPSLGELAWLLREIRRLDAGDQYGDGGAS
jgi:hypothetical protein